jgi:hypothetical protein
MRGQRAAFSFGDIGAGTGTVLDDEWLAEPLRQPLCDQAREDVGRPASGKAIDDAHRPRRIGLRRREDATEAAKIGGVGLQIIRDCLSSPGRASFRPPD